MLIFIMFGVIAYFFSTKMIGEGDILELYGDLLRWMERKGSILKWLSNPLGRCHYCSAAMWSVVFIASTISEWDIYSVLYVAVIASTNGSTAVFLKKYVG